MSNAIRKVHAVPTPSMLSRVRTLAAPFPNDTPLPPFLARLGDAELAAVLIAYHAHNAPDPAEDAAAFVSRVLRHVRAFQRQQERARAEEIHRRVAKGWVWKDGALYSPAVAAEDGMVSDPLPVMLDDPQQLRLAQ